jgi:hypothetical protein
VQPYITGDRLTVYPASPLTVTACAGITSTSYITGAGIGPYSTGCFYQVGLGGRLQTGQVIGTETILIPNTLASGSPLQQTVRFCSAPGSGDQGVCNAVLPSINVTGPASTVVDEIPPTFTSVPPDTTLDATSPAGAVGAYGLPTATDNAPGPVTVSCSPAPGSTFAIGVTIVTCTATDSSANTASESFLVTVINTFRSLCRVTQAAITQPGIAHSLCVKLQNAADSAAASDTHAMKAQLNAYINEVKAQSGKAINAHTAAGLEGLAALLMP